MRENSRLGEERCAGIYSYISSVLITAKSSGDTDLISSSSGFESHIPLSLEDSVAIAGVVEGELFNLSLRPTLQSIYRTLELNVLGIIL